VLIHIGIDTVKLQGEGFDVLVEEGDQISAGDKLAEFDLDYIRNHGASTITPVVFTNLGGDKAVVINKKGRVLAKEKGIVAVNS
jgi:glucose PTS system EIICBA or EIICB component